MSIEDDRPTARMAPFRLDRLLAVETAAAQDDDDERTIQQPAPVAVATEPPPPSDRTVIMR